MTPSLAAKKLLRGGRVRIGFMAKFDTAMMEKVLNISVAVRDLKRFEAYMNKAGEIVLHPLNGGAGFNSTMEAGAVEWQARAIEWTKAVKQAMIKKGAKHGMGH